MDKDLLEKFIIETFFSDNSPIISKIVDFIDLSKEEQILQIKSWANDRANLLNDKKLRLEEIRAASEQAINEELIKLDTIKQEKI